MFVSGYPDISDYPCHMCMIKYLSGPLHMIMGCFFFAVCSVINDSKVDFVLCLW